MKKKSSRNNAALKSTAGNIDKAGKHDKKHSSSTAQPAALLPWASLQERREQLEGIRPGDPDPYRFNRSL